MDPLPLFDSPVGFVDDHDDHEFLEPKDEERSVLDRRSVDDGKKKKNNGGKETTHRQSLPKVLDSSAL